MRRHLFAGCLALFVVIPARADDAKEKPVVVPFELLKTKHMAVQVKVNGKGPYRLIFDTGAPATLINNRVAKEAGLLKKVRQPAFSLFGSVGTVKVDKLEVGDVAAENVPAVVMDHPLVEGMAKKLGPIDGIVGFSFFGRYRMTLDYQAKQMTLAPTGYDPPDAMEAMTAALTALLARDKPPVKVLTAAAQWGTVVAKDADDHEAGVTVKEVLAGGPAALAGVQPGDRLLTLDDRWTDSVADCYAAAGRVKPGQAVKITIKRGSEEKELTVKPVAGL